MPTTPRASPLGRQARSILNSVTRPSKSLRPSATMTRERHPLLNHSRRVRACALKRLLARLLGLVCSSAMEAAPLGQWHGQRVMLVILENADYDTARAQPFLAKLARPPAIHMA